MTEKEKKLFGIKLRIYRGKKKLSQEDTANMLCITLRQYQRWEKGEAKPRKVYHRELKKIFPKLSLA